MGEKQRKLSATARFIAKHPFCYLCGGTTKATTRDHVPPKALFNSSHRPHGLEMPACDACNRGTSTTDLVVAIISRWNTNSDNDLSRDHEELAARVQKQAPELVNEWVGAQEYGLVKARRHLRKKGITIPLGAAIAMIGPLTTHQLNLFAYKVVMALYFDQFQRPLSEGGAVWAIWRSKEDFALNGVPERLLAFFDQYATLTQGRWSVPEIFQYRFACNEEQGLFGCIVNFRNGLFVAGFAVSDKTTVVGDPTEWIGPASLEIVLRSPRFLTKG